jgi:hypothetical protein
MERNKSDRHHYGVPRDFVERQPTPPVHKLTEGNEYQQDPMFLRYASSIIQIVK